MRQLGISLHYVPIVLLDRLEINGAAVAALLAPPDIDRDSRAFIACFSVVILPEMIPLTTAANSANLTQNTQG